MASQRAFQYSHRKWSRWTGSTLCQWKPTACHLTTADANSSVAITPSATLADQTLVETTHRERFQRPNLEIRSPTIKSPRAVPWTGQPDSAD